MVGKSDGKRPLGRPKLVWEGNIRAYLQEVGCRGIDWIDVAEDKVQVAGTFICGNEQAGSGNCGGFLD